jgi:hypothetical protein
MRLQVMLLLRVCCSSECGVPFIALEGRWSVVEAGCRCGRTKRCEHTCNPPPLVMDGPDPWSLVGCKSVAWNSTGHMCGCTWQVTVWCTDCVEGRIGLLLDDGCGGCGCVAWISGRPWIQVLQTLSLWSNRHKTNTSYSSKMCLWNCWCPGSKTWHMAGAGRTYHVGPDGPWFSLSVYLHIKFKTQLVEFY